MIKNLTFIASDGEELRTSVFINEELFSGNSLILVHGFKGFKDWGFGPYLADYFAKKGFLVVTFNFSHNGIGENTVEFTELEKFAENTFSREVRELNEIIDALRNNFFGFGSKGKLGLVGHSRGGAISLLTASKINDVDAAAVWASISKLDRYSKRQKEEWRKKSSFDVMNMRTKQIMKLNLCLLDDIEKNSAGSLNIENAVKNFNKPLLIVHGDQDLAVPIAEAEQLYEWSDKSKTEFYKLFGTGHTFGIVHPFAGTNHKFEKLLEKTTDFFTSSFN
ncbi:MAG: alpha/beta hydrolase [Ignavibacteriales bacterium]|nr:alpha/beta hydrolase [Ignavibacteriales bacterium]